MLNTGDALERSASTTDGELQACAELLAFGEQSSVAPDASAGWVLSSVLVAASVPPSADAADHLGDAFVCKGAIIAHHFGQTGVVLLLDLQCLALLLPSVGSSS